jgi:hypothetical protein
MPLPDLILRSASSRVSKDEWHQPGYMVRDARKCALLTMRIDSYSNPGRGTRFISMFA